MMDRSRTVQLLCAVMGALALSLLAPLAAAANTLHPRLLAKVGYGTAPVGFARTADGVLHLVFESNTNWGDAYSGIGAVSISPAGHVGPAVQALNWNGQSAQGIPGLAVMPSGALQATWGGYPFGPNGPWGISSSDGGASWSAPANVGSGVDAFGDSTATLAVSNGTPVIASGCCGGIVIQQGFGPGANTYQLTNSADNVASIPDLAVDAATGSVIAGWGSNAGSGGLWLQQVAPSQGTAVKMAVPSQYGTGIPPTVAGRDTGAGVFASYPANYANTTQMRLLRYGGGSVSIGSVKHLHTDVWGAATGNHGRLWVMWWGQNTKTGKQEIAVTRSNNADTAFEPIQVFGLSYSFLFTLTGDGRNGPLDLLITGTPSGNGATGGIYYARFVPVLSASVAAVSLGGGQFKLNAHVTDAGDPVTGATVSAKGSQKLTNGNGNAKLTVSGHSGQHVTVTISAPGYQTLTKTVTL
jgi:hypothetical protein